MAGLRARLITWRPSSAMTDAVAGWPRLGRWPEALPAGGTRWERTDVSRWPGCGRLVGESEHISAVATGPAGGSEQVSRCDRDAARRTSAGLREALWGAWRLRPGRGRRVETWQIRPHRIWLCRLRHARATASPGWGTLHPPPITDFTKRLRELLSRAAMDLRRMCAEREHVPSGIRQLVTGQLPPDGMNGACAETGSGARRCA